MISEYLAPDCYPGYTLLIGIAILSCFWAGVQPFGFTIAHITALTALALSLRSHPDALLKNLNKRIFLSGLVFTVVLAFNILYHRAPASGVDMLLMTLDVLLILGIMASLPRKTLKPLFSAFCILGTLLAVLHISIQIVYQNSDAIPGFLKHGGHHFGVFALLIAFPSIGAFFTSHRRSIRILGITAAISNLIYLLIDHKTIPVCLAFLGVIIFVIRSRKHTGTSYYLIFIVIVTILGFTGFHLSQWLLQDLYMSLALEDPLRYHQFPMMTAWKAGLSHPLMGVGAGKFPEVSGMFKPMEIDQHIFRAHNGIFEIFAELGLPGVLALAVLIVFVLISAFRLSSERTISRWIHRGFKTSLLLMIPAMLWDFGPQLPANLLLIAFSAGFLLADNRQFRLQQKKSDGYRWLYVIPLAGVACLIPALIAGVTYEVGRLLEREGRLSSSAGFFEVSVRLCPSDDRFSAAAGLVCNRLAALAGGEDQYQRALKHLDKSLHRNPLQSPLHYARAFTLYALYPTDLPERTFALKEAVRIDPGNHRYSMAYSQSLILSGNIPEGMAEIDRTISILTPEDHREFSEDFIGMWSDPKMIEEYLTTRFDRIEPALMLTILKRMMHHGYDDLAKPLTKSYALRLPTEKITELHLSYLKLLNSQGELQTAIDLVNKWESHALDTELKGRLLATAGDAFHVLGMGEEAMSYFDSAIQISPDVEEIRVKRLKVLKKQADAGAMITEMEKLLLRFPDSHTAHFAVAREYQRMGMALKALQEFRIANHLSGNRYRKDVSTIEDSMELPELFRDDFYEKEPSL